jgi:hypothetical protein
LLLETNTNCYYFDKFATKNGGCKLKLKLILSKFTLLSAILTNQTALSMSITDYSHTIDDLKTDLSAIHQQYLDNANNVVVLETLTNQLFHLDYPTITTQGLDAKKNILNEIFKNISLNSHSTLSSWNLNDFIRQLQKTGADLELVKQTVSNNHNNVAFLEIVLKTIFGFDYAMLIRTNFGNKKLNFQSKLKKIDTPIIPVKTPRKQEPVIVTKPYLPVITDKTPIPAKRVVVEPEQKDAYADVRTGPLIPAEIALLREMESDHAHFRDLGIVEGQHQKGVTCGSHAIINAWAIEQLLTTGQEITAANIFAITAPYFGAESATYTKTGRYYPINHFIHVEEICTQIPKLLQTELEQTDFKNRLNFAGYHTADIGTGRKGVVLEEAGVHLQDKFTTDEDFLNLQNMSWMRDQYKQLLAKPPHVEHFLYNSGGHWVLASVVQRPGEDAVVYFIDSMGSEALNRYSPITSRLVLSLYENFVKN